MKKSFLYLFNFFETFITITEIVFNAEEFINNDSNSSMKLFYILMYLYYIMFLQYFLYFFFFLFYLCIYIQTIYSHKNLCRKYTNKY